MNILLKIVDWCVIIGIYGFLLRSPQAVYIPIDGIVKLCNTKNLYRSYYG